MESTIRCVQDKVFIFCNQFSQGCRIGNGNRVGFIKLLETAAQAKHQQYHYCMNLEALKKENFF
jgi:hypothetical protein